MIEAHFTRGDTIFIRLQFLDKDRNPTSPVSVSLYITYKRNGQKETDVLTMIGEDSGVFKAAWNSAHADPGYVYWHARTQGDFPQAKDGQFVLTANPANPKEP